MRRRRYGSATAALVILGGVFSAGCPRPPRALDPLTPEEKQAAERIARSDPAVIQQLLQGRTELVYVTFFPLKPAAPGTDRDPDKLVMERAAEVVFYRFDGDFGVRAIVNLVSKKVTVQRLEGADVPISKQDWTDALRLALNNPEIQKALGADLDRFRRLTQFTSNAATLKQDAVRSLQISTSDPNDPCYRNRCVQLLFRKEGMYLLDSAIVNLTTGTVRIQKGSGKTP